MDRNEWNTNLIVAFIYGLMGYFYVLFFYSNNRWCGKGMDSNKCGFSLYILTYINDLLLYITYTIDLL